MAIKNYTTKIEATRTVAEIQALLGEKGASRVACDYEGGRPVAIGFLMQVAGEMVPFRIQANAAAVQKRLELDRVEKKYQTIQHAERVAWRLVLEWIEVQIAFIEAGQASMAQLLLGYSVTKTGETFWEMMMEKESGGKLLAEHL